MQRVREEFDADRSEERFGATAHPTETNSIGVNCSYCNGSFFVSEDVAKNINRAVNEGLDNPFVCPDCEQEYADLERAGGQT